MHNLRVNDVRRLVREEAGRIAMSSMTAAPCNPDARLALRDLDRAITKLPEVQRAVVLLIGLEGMTYEQASEVLSVPIGTVRSRLARARAELRERLLRPQGLKGRGAAISLSSGDTLSARRRPEAIDV
jgi:RNA polymerase sigma-70 factor (ECF subfamily)